MSLSSCSLLSHSSWVLNILWARMESGTSPDGTASVTGSSGTWNQQREQSWGMNKYSYICGVCLSLVLHCSFGSHEQLKLLRAKILMKYIHIHVRQFQPIQCHNLRTKSPYCLTWLVVVSFFTFWYWVSSDSVVPTYQEMVRDTHNAIHAIHNVVLMLPYGCIYSLNWGPSLCGRAARV